MRRSAGFTLIELLTVMAIVAILALLALVSLMAIRGTSVSTGAHMLQDTLNLARQLAVTQNRMTEVRFYQTAGAAAAASPTYSALRIEIYDVAGTTATPASGLLYLPTSVVLVSDMAYSTLLASGTNPASGTETLPGVGSTTYRMVDFRPSGATTLGGTSDQWFASVKMASDAAVGGVPAKNFATVQLDPITGRTLMYQP